MLLLVPNGAAQSALDATRARVSDPRSSCPVMLEANRLPKYAASWYG